MKWGGGKLQGLPQTARPPAVGQSGGVICPDLLTLSRRDLWSPLNRSLFPLGKVCRWSWLGLGQVGLGPPTLPRPDSCLLYPSLAGAFWGPQERCHHGRSRLCISAHAGIMLEGLRCGVAQGWQFSRAAPRRVRRRLAPRSRRPPAAVRPSCGFSFTCAILGWGTNPRPAP